MKKIIVFSLLILVGLGFVGAQSLKNNSYYVRSLELQTEAEAAFDEGEYDLAAELASQAQDYARLSDEYVAKMLLMHDASQKLSEAQHKYDWAVSVKAELRFAEAFLEAGRALELARAAFSAEEFDEAIVFANTVLASLSAVTDQNALPQYFVVRDLSKMEDCFWRIAELPFVYNDPYKWPLLYKANKNSLPEPNNPDLILPGMKLLIPQAGNEYREGIWTEDYKYPVYQGK